MTISWYDGATLTVEVGFASDPTTAIGSTTWTDISQYVRSIQPRRGRNDELGTFSAGTMQVVLSNADRRFDPSYTSSPYSPNVLPMKRMRFKATYNAVTYAAWSGFVDDWPQEYDLGGHDATVTVRCTDGFKVLSLLKLPESVYAVEIAAAAPMAWWRLGEQSGTQAVDSSGNGNDGTYVGGATFNTRTGLIVGSTDNAIAFDAVGQYVSVPPLSLAYPFSIEGWIQYTSGGTETVIIFRQFDNDNQLSVTAQLAGSIFVVLGTGGVANFQTATTTATTFGDGNPHHVVVTFANGTSSPTVYVDGVAQACSTSGSGTSVLPIGGSSTAAINADLFSGTIDEVAVYNSALSASDVSDHYGFGTNPWAGDSTGTRVGRFLDLVGWPSADRTIATGLSTLQYADLRSAAILQALQDIEASEQGQLFMSGDGKVIFRDRHWRFENTAAITSQATFGDNGGELFYAAIVTDGGEQFLVNHVRASRERGAVIDVSDAASILKFYERLDDVSGLQNESDLEVRDLASWRLGTRKNPVLRVVSLEVKPRSLPVSLFAQVLGRDIGERLTVKRRPQGVGSALTYSVLIEGIEHAATVGGEWRTTWYLSSSDSQAGVQPLILDDATFGILDTNVLGF